MARKAEINKKKNTVPQQKKKQEEAKAKIKYRGLKQYMEHQHSSLAFVVCNTKSYQTTKNKFIEKWFFALQYFIN